MVERFIGEHLEVSQAIARALPVRSEVEALQLVNSKPKYYAVGADVDYGRLCELASQRNPNCGTINIDLKEYLSWLENSVRNPLETAKRLEMMLSPEARKTMKSLMDYEADAQRCSRLNGEFKLLNVQNIFSTGEYYKAFEEYKVKHKEITSIDRARALSFILIGVNDHSGIMWEPRIDLRSFFRRNILPVLEETEYSRNQKHSVPKGYTVRDFVHKNFKGGYDPFHTPSPLFRTDEDDKDGLTSISPCSQLVLPTGGDTKRNLLCYDALRDIFERLSKAKGINKLVFHPGDHSCFIVAGKI